MKTAVYLLMWAISPTDYDIQNSYVHSTYDSAFSCEEADVEVTQIIRQLTTEERNDHLFCISVNELNDMRSDPIGGAANAEYWWSNEHVEMWSHEE